jgi:P-type Ca2+ transporter type 2C
VIIFAGTLTKNEQTVKELYTVDETVHIDSSGVASYHHLTSLAMKKAVEIGAICNNASGSKNQDGQYIGQSTDVALLNILEVLGIPDPRVVRSLYPLLFF